MTRIIYDVPVLFETNGDCSAITINFTDDDDKDLVIELRHKLKEAGFNIRQIGLNDQQLTIRSPKCLTLT